MLSLMGECQALNRLEIRSSRIIIIIIIVTVFAAHSSMAMCLIVWVKLNAQDPTDGLLLLAHPFRISSASTAAVPPSALAIVRVFQM